MYDFGLPRVHVLMSPVIETDHPCTQLISGRDDILPWSNHKLRYHARSVNPKVDHVSVRGTQEKTTLDETITSWMVCNILFMARDTDGCQG